MSNNITTAEPDSAVGAPDIRPEWNSHYALKKGDVLLDSSGRRSVVVAEYTTAGLVRRASGQKRESSRRRDAA